MAFSGVDPVQAGFVASLNRPGGNVTGLTMLAPELSAKRLDIQVVSTERPGAYDEVFAGGPCHRMIG